MIARGLPGAAVLMLLLTGCAGGTAGADGLPKTRVLVSAAASLADAFREVATAFEEAHPEMDVVLNVAGSSTLREQIVQGAPADVLASADTETMQQVVEAGLVVGDPAVFATNTLVIAVSSGNPTGVTGLDDLAEVSRYVGLCAAEVPCGRLARQALAGADVTPSVDTNEPDVRALLTKVAAGELDAGITYVTDVLAAGDVVEAVTIAPAVNVTTHYPIALLAEAPEPAGAGAFVTFVLSEEGRRILGDHGFGLP